MQTAPHPHGLSRYIPADIAREVRKRSGFGCIFCRSAIIEYDHFDPEFKNAKVHDPDGIVALCGVHHTARGNGQISAQQVREKLRQIRNHQEFSRYKFELNRFPEIRIGLTRIVGVRQILEVDNEDILSFRAPESTAAPPLLNAKFYNRRGMLAAEIVDNEWRAHVGNWDVVVSGDTYTVRSNRRKIALELRLQQGKVAIKRLNLRFNDATIKVAGKGVVTVRTQGNDGAKLIIPDVPNVTKDWLHWINVSGKKITWCAENIHQLLSRVPQKKLPLKIADKLYFGSSRTVMAIPMSVRPTGDPEQPWADDGHHGEFQKITLNKIGLCPHSHSSNSTMYVMETNHADGHVSSPYVANLEWVKLAREAESLIKSNSRDVETIHQLFNAALASINEEGGKIHQWAWLMTMKIQGLQLMGDIDKAQSIYDELSCVAPEYVTNTVDSPWLERLTSARGT